MNVGTALRMLGLAILFLGMFGGFWPNQTQARVQYDILDLGTLGGNMSLAYAINQQGAVAGKSTIERGVMEAFYWDRAHGMIPITRGEAWGINDYGQVVGNYHFHADDAFIWDVNEGLFLFDKGDYIFATAFGINNLGKVAGYARRFNDIAGTEAIVWDAWTDTFEVISTPALPALARAINDQGDVVGEAGVPSRAFLWNEHKGFLDLGSHPDLEGSWNYVAMGLNVPGQVVGYARSDSGEYRAFQWSAEKGMVLLPGQGNSLAYGINRHGHAVGADGAMIGAGTKALLWKNGERMALDGLIGPGLGWELREARSINDRGQIVGTGTLEGQYRAFLMTPIPSVKANIQANGLQGDVQVSAGEQVSISVSLDPGSWAGEWADWWIGVQTPFDPPGDWYTYVYEVYEAGWFPGIHLGAQTPLFLLSLPFEVLNMALPPGDYTFLFGIDPPDALPAGPWWGMDAVEVRIRE